MLYAVKIRKMSKQATTPTEKYQYAKCKDCIHYWKREDNKAVCTHPNMLNKLRSEKSFNACDYFEK